MEKINRLISIYIPTYNRLELLRRAIESVLVQSYQNWELIVVDDCSTDGTIQYLEDLSKIDSRIRYILKNQNGGACESRNMAINVARGEYITGLDDDDYFLPDRLECFMRYSSLLTSYKFLASNYLVLKNNKERASILSRFKNGVFSIDDICLSNLVGNQIFTYTSRLKNELYDVDMKIWQDLELWLRLLRNGECFFVIRNGTYVLDASHDFSRISTARKEKVNESVFRIKSKVKLKSNQLKDLEYMASLYGVGNVSLRPFNYFIRKKSILSFLLFLSGFKRYIRFLLQGS